MPYVQSFAVFLLVCLNVSGISNIGDLSPEKPYLYLMALSLVSFFMGIWALFSLFGITSSYNTLSQHRYGWKSGLFKTTVVLTNVQGFVIDSLANYGIIPCLGPKIGHRALGIVIKGVATCGETLLLSSVALRLFLTSDDDHV